MNSTFKAKRLKTGFLIELIFILCFDIAKGDDALLSIKLNNYSPVQYCTSPVIVAINLTIEGTFAITGMKISINEGFVSGEDELVYSGIISSIKGTWDPAKGVLQLVQNGSVTPTNIDYRDAIKTVTYKNNNTIPTLGVRKISITLDDADYLDETKHFYQFISKPKIKWTDARDAAAATLYHGLLRGYLATILTKGESDFINLKTLGLGWIGASDAKVEEEWRWVTGPEGLMGGGDGLLFWKGSGIKAKLNNPPSVYGPVIDPQGNPYYFNWNNWDAVNSPDPCTYEPNNWVSVNGVITCGANNVPGEDYAHITINKKWNDYANDNQSTSGYLIEFGGMPGDPLVQLSATLDLQVNTVLFKTHTIPAICQGDTVMLNRNLNAVSANYSWTPVGSLSNGTIANPIATPSDTTTYTVICTRGACSDTAYFKVDVIPKPDVSFSIDSTTCIGYNLDVSYTGRADPAISEFTWVFGRDTVSTGVGNSKINIPLGVSHTRRDLILKVMKNGCSNTDSIRNIHVIPKLSLWSVRDSMLCLPDSFEFFVTQPDPLVRYDWNFGDGKIGSGINIIHRYRQSGKYAIQLAVTNSDNCSNTAKIKDMVYAEPVPVASFSMDHPIVYNNQPTVKFQNETIGASSFLWDFGDGFTAALENPVHNFAVTGYCRVLLKVASEFGCNDTVSHSVLIAFDRIYPPNSFSPNAPDQVDRLFLLNSEGIAPAGYHFTVYSRWDDVVFEVKNEIKGWDGRMNSGYFAPAGAYVWILNFTDFLGRKHSQTGTLTLIY